MLSLIILVVQSLNHTQSLQPRGLYHPRLLYPPLNPRLSLNSCPLSQWRYVTISSFVIPFPPAVSHFSIRVFSSVLALHIWWPKDWSFSFSSSPSNEYSGLISFSVDLFDLLAVQGTPKSFLQHHNSKASISLQSKGLPRAFSSTIIQKHQFFSNQPSLWLNSHIYAWLLEEP